MAGLKHYDPKQILITYGEVLVEGYGEDTFAKVAPRAEQATLVVGADGSGTRSISNDRSATIEFTLSQSSPTNALLSALAKIDRATGQGVRPLIIKDKNGTTLHMAATAFISKTPDDQFGAKVGERTWTFLTDALDSMYGESSPPPAPTT